MGGLNRRLMEWYVSKLFVAGHAGPAPLERRGFQVKETAKGHRYWARKRAGSGPTFAAAVKEMSGVKAFGAEAINRIMYDCVQFHGGMGYMIETPVERMYRDARILPIGGGATEVMLEEVAKRSMIGA